MEYHWLEGKFDRLPTLMADLARRRVAVIATPAGNQATQVAKAATTAIPITGHLDLIIARSQRSKIAALLSLHSV